MPIPGLLGACEKTHKLQPLGPDGSGVVTDELHNVPKHLQKQLEEGLSLSYCAAKVAAVACFDLLQELSDAVDLCPHSTQMRERKTLVSRSIDFLRRRQGRAAAQALLQLAYQEPPSTGLPAEVANIKWHHLSQSRDDDVPSPLTPAQASLMEWINPDKKRPDATLLTIVEHLAGVNAVKVFPCGKLLVSASDDGDILICSAQTGELKCRLAGHNNQGRHGCLCKLEPKAGFFDRKSITHNDDCTLDGHEGMVTSIDISVDGRRLVSTGIDGKIRIWERQAETCLFSTSTTISFVASEGPHL